jgi:hypothetical protein
MLLPTEEKAGSEESGQAGALGRLARLEKNPAKCELLPRPGEKPKKRQIRFVLSGIG